MAGLIPFNRRNHALSNFGDFYDVLDDFFSDSRSIGRNLARDTFKLDVKEDDKEYQIEAELPGVSKDEIDLALNDGILSISVSREEKVNEGSGNYIHRERRLSSMSRSIRLADASPESVKAKLENGMLSIAIAKQTKNESQYKIEIE